MRGSTPNGSAPSVTRRKYAKLSTTDRSVTSTSARFRSSSSCWIWAISTQSCASGVAPSLRPSGLNRMTSRPTSTLRPARPIVLAKACTAFVLRTECEPMKAILASLVHGIGAVIVHRRLTRLRADRLACCTEDRAVAQPIERILVRHLGSRLSVPLFLVDTEGTLVFYNEAAEGLLGRRFD